MGPRNRVRLAWGETGQKTEASKALVFYQSLRTRDDLTGRYINKPVYIVDSAGAKDAVV
jgi:hypothetical protein